MSKPKILELSLSDFPKDEFQSLTVKINIHNHKSAVSIRAPEGLDDATLAVLQKLLDGVSETLDGIFADKIIEELEDAIKWFRGDDWNVPVTNKSLKPIK